MDIPSVFNFSASALTSAGTSCGGAVAALLASPGGGAAAAAAVKSSTDADSGMVTETLAEMGCFRKIKV